MEPRIFEKFRKIVYAQSGIYLRDGKESLVSARVAKLMRALGINSHRAYLKHVIADESGEEVIRMIDAISTNVTSFYRENEHFEFLKDKARKWLYEGAGRLRIWSAACSSGEEPYSIGITLREAAHNDFVDMKILSTDISTQILDRARRGVYKKENVKPVPPTLLKKYFDIKGNGHERQYSVKDKIKKMVIYCRLNLSSTPFPMKGPFDVIFCRNVMIYFDNEVRQKLLSEMYRLLRPGGYLIVGHAESLTGILSDFKSVKPSIYIKQRKG